MALISERRDDYLMLRPLGVWDANMQRELEAQIMGQAAIGVRNFVVDLLATEHLKFRIIPELLSLYGQVIRSGGDLVISSPSPYLLEILAAGDVPGRISVFPSEASAALGISSASVAFWDYLQDGERPPASCDSGAEGDQRAFDGDERRADPLSCMEVEEGLAQVTGA